MTSEASRAPVRRGFDAERDKGFATFAAEEFAADFVAWIGACFDNAPGHSAAAQTDAETNRASSGTTGVTRVSAMCNS